jgi:RNA polymerase sigma-70 factor (ECF subfamily)
VTADEKSKTFETVVLSHMNAAYTLAYWLVWNKEDAHDLVQEALLRAFKAFDKFQGNEGRAWLFTIVRNLFYNSIPKRSINHTSYDDTSHGCWTPSANPEVLFFRQLETELVRDAIRDLSPEFREVLILRELEELSYKEIGVIIQAPIGTVMSRLARARAQLRRSLLNEYQLSRAQQSAVGGFVSRQ